MSEADASLFLSPYRVLDLTDERGLLCGKILADLGADVVQIEPPEGSHARNLGPYYRDQVHPERSLFWWAYANNKRSITLNLETSDGRDILGRLVKDAHFLLESFSPGYLDGLGAGYRALSAINPGLVMVSITAFGQSGPYSERAATDLVGMATGGIMYLTGDSDRAPVRVGFPQFYLHGSAAGATGAMLAHTHRALTGEGQHVDVSCQQATARSLAHAPQFWDIQGIILKRMGVFRQSAGETMTRINWRCKNGYVNFQAGGGGAGSVRSVRAPPGVDGPGGYGGRVPELGGVGEPGIRHSPSGDHGEDGRVGGAVLRDPHPRGAGPGRRGAAHHPIPGGRTWGHHGVPPARIPQLFPDP